jgi:hypothetical protein
MDISEMLGGSNEADMVTSIPEELQSEEEPEDHSEDDSGSEDVDDDEEARPRKKVVRFIDELATGLTSGGKKKSKLNVQEQNEVYDESEFHVGKSTSKL